ncbi:MAG: 50S ribosomal protein L17 [Firmicutes bacterium]|nr:50S ribosomal protein L17 [Bacillota bacterium]
MYARKLGRSTSHRMSMLRNLVMSLFVNGRVVTTYSKAKEVEFFVGKYVPLMKCEPDSDITLHNKRRIFSYFGKNLSKEKIYEIALNFANRKGGFTRVIKLGPRRGDAAEMAVIELVN